MTAPCIKAKVVLIPGDNSSHLGELHVQQITVNEPDLWPLIACPSVVSRPDGAGDVDIVLKIRDGWVDLRYSPVTGAPVEIQVSAKDRKKIVEYWARYADPAKRQEAATDNSAQAVAAVEEEAVDDEDTDDTVSNTGAEDVEIEEEVEVEVEVEEEVEVDDGDAADEEDEYEYVEVEVDADDVDDFESFELDEEEVDEDA